MSNNYIPDNDATAGYPWNTTFLSDRDVSGRVPINFVPHPGVHLTAACFSNGVYEDQSFEECFSNLLASEFRRFVVDIYWDTLNRKFRFCPVEVPQQNITAESMSIVPRANVFLGTYQASSMTRPSLLPRQASIDNSNSSTNVIQSSATTATTASTSIPPVTTTTSTTGSILYQLGPYTCSDSLNLDTLTSVLIQYISETSNTIAARLQFIILNIHVASLISAPTSPGPTLSQSELPNSNELVYTYINELNSLIYTPSLLQTQRANLNDSWYSRRSVANFPESNYFTLNKLPNGDLSTPDGWPNEDWVQLQQGWRLLLGYGDIDSQIRGYDFDGDNSTIFSPGYLVNDRAAKIDSSGRLSSGCFYDSGNEEVNKINSSWAVSSVMNIDQSILGYAVDNLTCCGISPILNYTLNNQPANTNYEAYQNFGNQALFSWASGEPKNATASGESSDTGRWACALMVSNDEYQGHWRVSTCQNRYRVACREANRPYTWRLSVDAVPYGGGDAACTGNSTFDVPRTGLENTYLFHHIRSISSAEDDSSLDEGIWVNFNQIDVTGCWVATGINGTCPWYQDENTIRQRQILVPTIAAFITICITALTLLVKCNTNRRKSKVRKRGEGGWDYEGVPS